MKAKIDLLFSDWVENKNEDSFTRLYINVQKIIFSKFSNYFEEKDKLNDLIQNAWIKIIKAPGKLDIQKGSFVNYFITIIKNDALKLINKGKREENFVLEDFDDLADENIDIEKEDLSELLMGIPEIFRDTLILHFYYDVEIKEIGRMLGVAHNTVKTRISRGKKAIKNMIESK